jgi:steroid 5-alpha reductase family enzyme
MDFLSAYQVSCSVVFSMMTALWIASLIAKDASLVDRFWGAGFVFITWALALMSMPLTPIKILLCTIVSIWGLRLSIYIHWRNRGHGEDYRYVEMRKHHGSNFWWYSFLSVFTLQGVLMLLISAPLIFVMSSSEAKDITPTAVVGTIFWLTGFIFEAGGDWQLQSFLGNPNNKGQLLRKGLWSVTRHPNYFGDALQWWGYGMFAWSYGILPSITFLGPILMTLFIRKVSGVDLLEKNLINSKPGYAEYIASTPPFFPRKKFWIILLAISAAACAIFLSLCSSN